MSTSFQKNDSGFVCAGCGAEVPPLRYSSRNHCPFCLCSLHADIEPGDRMSGCFGLMIPAAVTIDGKKGFIIRHKCKKCGFERNNKSQKDDDTALLIHLTNPFNQPKGGKS